MDCCGSNKPKETNKEIEKEQTSTELNPVEKEDKHGGGCCGDGTKDMMIHIVLMVVVVLVVSYFTRG